VEARDPAKNLALGIIPLSRQANYALSEEQLESEFCVD
jgi:hypothetical protein